MLGEAAVRPTIPAVDLERAKKFYQDTLGLKFVAEDPAHGAILSAGRDTYLYLYQRGATKADHTVASFTVSDVEAAVKELKGKGVVFQNIDVPGLKTVDGIATMGKLHAAWFEDTEGNIIGVTDM